MTAPGGDQVVVGSVAVEVTASASRFARSLKREVNKAFSDVGKDLQRALDQQIGRQGIKLKVTPEIDQQALDQATRARSLALRPQVDRTSAANAGREASQTAERAAGPIRLKADVDRNSIGRVLSVLGNLAKAAVAGTAGIAAIGAIGQGISAALAGLVAAGAAAIQVLAQLGSVAITAAGALAAIPGAAAIAGAAIGALAIGFSGIGAALKEVTSGAGGAGGAAVDMGRQIERASRQVVLAERRVADSQRDARRAQEDLNRAREEARENLEDLALSLARARLDEEAAVFALADAEEELRQIQLNPFATADELARADLAYREAAQSLAEVREGLGDVTKEQAKAAKKGVKNADVVVDAQERQREAALALEDAQYDLAQAHLDLAEAQTAAAASGGGVASAFGKLSPAAQALVQTLAALKPAWDALRLDVQENLLTGVAGAVKNLADAQLPVLREGLVDVATVLNGAILTGLRTLSTETSKLRLGQILDHAASAINKLAVAVEPLLVGLLDLTAVGASVIDHFAEPLGEALAGFGEHISALAESGELRRIMIDGFEAAKLLFDALVDVGGILKGLFTAIGEGGGIFEILDALNEFVNSDAGQEGLTNFFAEVARIGTALIPVLEAFIEGLGIVGSAIGDIAEQTAPFLADFLLLLAEALASLAPGFIALAPSVVALGEALLPLATILADLVVGAAPGIEAFLLALADALTILAPVAKPVGEALGALLTALAPLLPVLGQALANSLTAAAIAITAFAEAFAPLIEEFSAGLIEELAAQMPAIAEAGVQLAIAFAELAKELAPLIPFLVDLTIFLAGSAANGLKLIATSVHTLAFAIGVFKAPFEAVVALFQILGGINWGGIGSAIAGAFSAAWEAVSGFFGDVGAWFAALPETITSAIGNASATLRAKGRDFISGLFAGITSRFANVTGWLRGLGARARTAVGNLIGTLSSRGRDLLQGLRNGITDRWNSARSWLAGIPGRAREAVGNLGRVLLQAGKNLIQGLIDGIQSRFDSVRNILNNLTSLLPDWKGPLELDLRILRPSGQAVIAGFERGVRDQMPSLRATLGGVTADIAGQFAARHDALGQVEGFMASDPAPEPRQAVMIDATGLPRALAEWLRGAVRTQGGGSVQRFAGQGARA